MCILWTFWVDGGYNHLGLDAELKNCYPRHLSRYVTSEEAFLNSKQLTSLPMPRMDPWVLDIEWISQVPGRGASVVQVKTFLLLREKLLFRLEIVDVSCWQKATGHSVLTGWNLFFLGNDQNCLEVDLLTTDLIMSYLDYCIKALVRGIAVIIPIIITVQAIKKLYHK